MNILFCILFFSSAIYLFLFSPETFLASMLDSASKSATLAFSLIATYAVWLGLMQVWKDSGITAQISKRLKPFTSWLFKTRDTETLDALSMNLSVNLLGIGGAGTPYGIRSAQLLDKSENAEYASSMLFVLNATSIQIIPTSIIGIRVALHSASPMDIFLPTLFTSLFSTLFAVLLCRILIPPLSKTQSSTFFKVQKKVEA